MPSTDMIHCIMWCLTSKMRTGSPIHLLGVPLTHRTRAYAILCHIGLCLHEFAPLTDFVYHALLYHSGVFDPLRSSAARRLQSSRVHFMGSWPPRLRSSKKPGLILARRRDFSLFARRAGLRNQHLVKPDFFLTCAILYIEVYGV